MKFLEDRRAEKQGISESQHHHLDQEENADVVYHQGLKKKKTYKITMYYHSKKWSYILLKGEQIWFFLKTGRLSFVVRKLPAYYTSLAVDKKYHKARKGVHISDTLAI